MKGNLSEEINRLKELMFEAPSSSNSLFGGGSIKIPAAGGHGKQSGWQSRNAWDIPTSIGTPVYAVTSGTLQTFSDYGPKPIHKNGKTLFGQSFTVKSSDGKPDVYYTHLMNSPLRKGSKINCGDLVGYVMDFPGSSYDHVHIGVQTGHDIRELVGDDGKIKCGKISGTIFNKSTNAEEEKSELNKILGTDIDGVSLKDLLGVVDDDFEDSDLLDTIINFAKSYRV